MKIIKDLEKGILSDYLGKNEGISGPEFLLSSEWRELLENEGEKCEFLAVVRDIDYRGKALEIANILAVILLVKKSLAKSYSYWYAPRGPLLNNSLEEAEKKKVANFLFSAISRVDKKALFLKIEPATGDASFWGDVFPKKSLQNLFNIKRVEAVQPKKTVILNLNKELDEILKSFHQKTRYNIRLAEKKGVTISGAKELDFSEFWRLMQVTGERDAFRVHEEKHYKNLLSSPEFIKLFFAEYEGKKIAAALICFYNQKATYLHGASDNEYRQVMAPQLLQWKAIEKAKEMNCKVYDFYGIDEKKWPGVTRFKLGFSNNEKVYAGAYDIIFRPAMYQVYRLLRVLKKYLQKIKK